MGGLNEFLVMAGILILCEIYYRINKRLRKKKTRHITRIRRIKRV